MDDTTIHVANFERFEQDGARSQPAAVRHTRRQALERFRQLGYPTSRHEDWRFTNVAAIARTPFKLADADGGLTADQLAELTGGLGRGPRLVFVNGRYARELSAVHSLPAGVVADSLADVLRRQPEAVEPHLARYARYDDHSFTALNTAFIRDGAFVSVPKGKVLDEPLHLVFLTTASGEPAVAHPRNLILAGQNCRLSVIESYAATGEGVYFTNAVTEVVTGPGSVVDHCKLQREGERAYHVARLQVRQDRGSRFSSHYVGLGGSLVRNEAHAVLDAEGCECTLNGLYLARGQQHADNFTVIDHAQPRCASHELYKGILDGKAHGVFNGKIFVRQDAQKTDAKQTNKTLLLSDDATINTKPQLEIYADDVKCTHGATVGQLDADAIFYLRSRGIDLAAARNLLIYAFANDIICRIGVESVRRQLEEVLLARQHLDADPRLKEVS
jgi:Fe-S cluster assembly protein SufD